MVVSELWLLGFESFSILWGILIFRDFHQSELCCVGVLMSGMVEIQDGFGDHGQHQGRVLQSGIWGELLSMG